MPELAQLQLRSLIVGPDLEDFLYSAAARGREAFVDEMIGDAGILRDRFVGLAGAPVEIAKGVGGIPVARLIVEHARVLADSSLEPALPEQLLRFFQRVFAVEGQERLSPPGRDGWSGLRIEFIKQ